MNLSFFYVYQTPIPADSGDFAKRIVEISIRLSSADGRYGDYASSLGVEYGALSMKERIELTAELNALVARHYGLTRDELQVILDSFEGFEEDEELLKIGPNVKWNDRLMRKFNGEVRKRVIPYFENIGGTMTGDSASC